MSLPNMKVDDLLVLVGTCVADGETWVVPDKQFCAMLHEDASERSRIFNPSTSGIGGYLSFTATICDQTTSYRLEDLQKFINAGFACWDEDSECFDTSICSGVADVYAFVNASALPPSAFGANVFSLEIPVDYQQPQQPVPQATAPRKPWLL